MLYNECINLIGKRKNNVAFSVRNLFLNAGYTETESTIFAATLVNTVIDFIFACVDLSDPDDEIRTPAVKNLFSDINRLCYRDVLLCLADKFGFSLVNDDEKIYIETPSADEFAEKILSFAERSDAPFSIVPVKPDLISLCDEAAIQFLTLEEKSKKAKYQDGLKLTCQQVYVICAVVSLMAENSDFRAKKLIEGLGMLHITGYSTGYGETNPEKAVETLATISLLDLAAQESTQKNTENQKEEKISTDTETVEEKETEENSTEVSKSTDKNGETEENEN